jgi:uncharacterized protein (DUF302 family)
LDYRKPRYLTSYGHVDRGVSFVRQWLKERFALKRILKRRLENMRPVDFTYVVESQRSVREALGAVWRAAEAAGWVIVGDYDLSRLLSAPGGQWEVKSIDICQPDLARPFVDAEKLTALCMPCNILIYADNTGTKLAVMRPSVVMPLLFQDTVRAFNDLFARIERELLPILEAAK